jgi:hypothetical protein
MSMFRKFAADTRGDALKSVALSAAVVAFASLTLTQLLDRATKDGALPHVAIVATPSQPYEQQRMAQLSGATQSEQYDDMPVGSIGGRPMPHIVLDPCNGQQR